MQCKVSCAMLPANICNVLAAYSRAPVIRRIAPRPRSYRLAPPGCGPPSRRRAGRAACYGARRDRIASPHGCDGRQRPRRGNGSCSRAYAARLGCAVPDDCRGLAGGDDPDVVDLPTDAGPLRCQCPQSTGAPHTTASRSTLVTERGRQASAARTTSRSGYRTATSPTARTGNAPPRGPGRLPRHFRPHAAGHAGTLRSATSTWTAPASRAVTETVIVSPGSFEPL